MLETGARRRGCREMGPAVPRIGRATARKSPGLGVKTGRMFRSNRPNRPARPAMPRYLAPLALIALLAACQTGTAEPEVRRSEPVQASLGAIPSDACWATDRVPAVVETRYDSTGPDGARAAQEVVLRPAEDRLFAVPCPDQMADDFTASLQRALSARGHYAGAITGLHDAETIAAIRRFQAPQGLDSGILSLQAAQSLGLVAMPRDAL